MKIFDLHFTLWYDMHWWAGRHKAWKNRKWYFTRVPVTIVGNHRKPYAYQLGPLTFKFIFEETPRG